MEDNNFIDQYFWGVDDFFMISKTDTNWIITYVNKNFCEVSWYSEEELLGQYHNIIKHEDMPEEFFKEMNHILYNKKRTFKGTMRNQRKDGNSFRVNGFIKPVFDENNELQEFISVMQDITQEKEKNESLFETIVENMWESVWIGDKDEKILYANPNFCNLLWYTQEEVIWKKPKDFLKSEEFGNVFKTSKLEVIMKSKSWEEIPVFLSWKMVKTWRHIGLVTDLRQIKSIKKMAEYQQAIEAANMVIKASKNKKITDINQHFKRATFFDEVTMLWKDFIEFVNEHNSAERIDSIKNHIESKQVWRGELIIPTNTEKGFMRTFSTVIPILDKEKKLEEILMVHNNVTEEKEYEAQIKEEKNKIIEKLEEINKTKDEFLNIASHELRTPLTTIKWYVSMLLEWECWEPDEEMRMYLKKILRSSNRLIDLINDMLDVQKLEAWKMDFYFEEFDVSSVINDVYSDMQSLAGDKNQKIVLNNNFKDLYIKSDYNKILQVLTNLVSNAIKFTPENWEVIINVWTKENNLYISVIDNWVGISEEDKEKIFEKFWQVKNSLTRNENWTWLWLPIVKNIVEELWWEIDVDTKEWEWSRFTVWLPLNN